jgi:hypothetical protein
LAADNRGVWISRLEFTVEGFQPVSALPRTGKGTRAASVLAWVRERLTTTPGRLALVSILVVAGAVCFGVIATSAERSRARAAQAVRTQTEPLLVQAVNLYSALSDANATATTTFLTGGLEPPARRARYLQDLRLASESLARLTREVGGSAGGRTAALTGELPAYSGLVEAARANNRQGLPVGAAYLRQASVLLTGTILPAADQLYATEARRLSDDYSSGTATVAFVVLTLVAAVSLGLLGLTQLYLARVSRRILNVPMLLATMLLGVLSIWALVGLIGEQNALARAHRVGSDSVEVLSATRVLLSRAQSDESLTLVNRGSDETDPADFKVVMRALAPHGGLIGEVAALAHGTGTRTAADQLATDFASYRAETTRVAALEANGQIVPAIGLAVRSAASPRSPADRLSANLAGQIAAAQRRFTSAAADATSSLGGLSIAIPVLTLLAGALALIGLRQRLSEYR